MSDLSSPELGNTQALTHMIDTMRKGQLDFGSQGNPVQRIRKLGGGGTKTVYDVVIDEGHFALAVPNTVDDLQTMIEKWRVALQEPANTKMVRSLGFYTNPVCEALPTSINGVSFTVLKMGRYEDLPYPIMDGKDPHASTIRGNVLPTVLDEGSFEELIGYTVSDIQSLIRNGLRVGVDSINICLINGKPRIFLSDLGDMRVEPFPKDRILPVAREYAAHAYSAFVQGLTEQEYQKHKAFFGGEFFKFSNPNNLRGRLGEKVEKSLIEDNSAF